MIEVRQHKISIMNVPRSIQVHFFSFLCSLVSCGQSTKGEKLIESEKGSLLVRPKSLAFKERNAKLTVRNTNAKTAIVAIIP